MRAVNLIPGEQLAGGGAPAGRSGGGAYAVLVLVGGLALLALLYGQARRDASSRRAHVATLNAQAQQAQAAAAGLAPYTNFVSLREEREHAVSQLIDARFDWAHAFHELGRVLPGKASITSIDGSVGASTAAASTTSSSASPGSASSGSGASGSSSGSGAKAASGPASSSATSATPPGSVPTVTVSGCATSQSEVALTLNRLRLVDGINEVTLQNSTKSNTTASASAAVGQCPAGAAVFSAVLTFQPLPAAGAATASAVPVSSAGGAR